MYLQDAEDQMKKAIDHLEAELGKIRAGKASPSMVDGITVDYYGVQTPIGQAATVNTQDAKTIVIKPWEKNMLEPIEKAIQAANIGINPQNDGDFIRLILPPLTEERRRDLVKNIRNHAEQTRVSVRNIRRDTMHHMKDLLKEGVSEDMEKRAEDAVDELTKKYTEYVEKHLEKKEEEVMTV